MIYSSASEKGLFWLVGPCGRDEVSRVLLQSRELSVPIERVLDVLKQSAVLKRVIGKKVMARWESGQLIKDEVRLFGSVTGDVVSSNYELVPGGTYSQQSLK